MSSAPVAAAEHSGTHTSTRADAQPAPNSAKGVRGASPYAEIENEPPPKLIVDLPASQPAGSGRRLDPVAGGERPQVGRDQYAAVDKALYSLPTRWRGVSVRARADRHTVRFYHAGVLIKTHVRHPPGGRATDKSDFPAERSAYALRDVTALMHRAEALGPAVGRYAQALLDVPSRGRACGASTRCSGSDVGTARRASTRPARSRSPPTCST
jgi:hypothetical protein